MAVNVKILGVHSVYVFEKKKLLYSYTSLFYTYINLEHSGLKGTSPGQVQQIATLGFLEAYNDI